MRIYAKPDLAFPREARGVGLYLRRGVSRVRTCNMPWCLDGGWPYSRRRQAWPRSRYDLGARESGRERQRQSWRARPGPAGAELLFPGYDAGDTGKAPHIR